MKGMAKPRFREAEPAFSLFPFLSVLVGVMGVMALIVSGMSLVGLQDADQVIELEHDPQTDKEAVFVECRHDGLLLHPEGSRVPLDDLRSSDSPWYRRLQTLRAERDQRYLVLLIRPDAIESFRQSLTMARAAGIDVGYDPVYATGEIRFRNKQPRSNP
jgi:hypothetical protein